MSKGFISCKNMNRIYCVIIRNGVKSDHQTGSPFRITDQLIRKPLVINFVKYIRARWQPFRDYPRYREIYDPIMSKGLNAAFDASWQRYRFYKSDGHTYARRQLRRRRLRDPRVGNPWESARPIRRWCGRTRQYVCQHNEQIRWHS